MHDLLGLLRFIADRTRPDIAFATSFMARFLIKPTKNQYEAVIRIIRYLLCTQDYCLKLGSKEPIELFAYVDASFANELDSKSQLAYYIYLSRDSGCVYWKSMKDRYVSISSTHSEIHALLECVKTVLWYRDLLEELGFEQKSPTVIYEDNANVITLCNFGGVDKNSKHLISKANYVREVLEALKVALQHIKTQSNAADIGTKSLDKECHMIHVNTLLRGHNSNAAA